MSETRRCPGCGGDIVRMANARFCGPECHRPVKNALKRQWYRDNAAKIKKSGAAYYNSHREEVKKRTRDYYYHNKDAVSARTLEYRKKNAERLRVAYRAWRLWHLRGIGERKRRWCEANKQRVRDKKAAWREKNRAKLRAAGLRRYYANHGWLKEANRQRQRESKSFSRWLSFTTLNLSFPQNMEAGMDSIVAVQEFRESLKGIETAELIKQFGEAMKSLEDFWIKNAWRLWELESRGITEEQLLGTFGTQGYVTTRWKRMFRYYREITGGSLDPRFAATFAADPGTFAYGRSRGKEFQGQLLQMTDQELNKLMSHRGTGGNSVGASNRKRGAIKGKAGYPNLIVIAQESSARDLIDMILEMVTNAADPEQVADGLMASLRGIAAPANGHAKPRRAARVS